MSAQSAQIRMLIVEDIASDAELMIHEIRRVGLNPVWHRVDNESDFLRSLNEPLDIILSDFNMPQFNAARALELLGERGMEVPFVVVTGSVSEEVAVDMMKKGAADYLLKDRLARLGPAVVAALEQKRIRDDRRRAVEATRAYAETQRILLLELDHRVRNNLSSLLALIDLSRHGTTRVDDFAESISGRVRAMASVHSLLSQSHWHSSELSQLIYAVTPSSGLNQVRASGPTVLVPHRQVTALGIVLHELITNSVKHGALSAPGGSVNITWSNKAQASPLAWTIEWIECGGPPVKPPPSQGAGTQLVIGLVKSELRGEASLNYPTTGAHHVLLITLDERIEPQTTRISTASMLRKTT